MVDPRPLVIVNADDFGLSEPATSAIVRCMDAGRISSTTIMANGEWFEPACELARAHGFADRIGIHLNLDTGFPLSRESGPILGSSGELSAPERAFFAPHSVLAAVYAELRAQIARVIASGIVPTHLDSHHHIINGVPYTRVAIALAREFGIERIRLTRNACYSRKPHKVLFKWGYNFWLRNSGIRTTRWFTDVKPYFHHVNSGGVHLPGPTELMCHPDADFAPPNVGWSKEADLLLSDPFGEFLQGVQLESYRAI